MQRREADGTGKRRGSEQVRQREEIRRIEGEEGGGGEAMGEGGGGVGVSGADCCKLFPTCQRLAISPGLGRVAYACTMRFGGGRPQACGPDAGAIASPLRAV